MRALVAIAVAVLAAAVSLAPASAQPSACRFVLGFAEAAATLGPSTLGQCVENQRTLTGPEAMPIDGRLIKLSTGQTVQRTTAGLLLWLPDQSTTRFVTADGFWFQMDDGMSYLTWAQWESYLAQSRPAPTAAALPLAQATAVPAAVQSQRDAGASCFTAYSAELLSTPLTASPDEQRRGEERAKAVEYLCGQATEKFGMQGFQCFAQAWDAATGMERVFPGSGKRTYDDTFTACISGR